MQDIHLFRETRSVKEIPHSLVYVSVPQLSPTGGRSSPAGRDGKGRRGIYAIDVTSGETSFVLPAVGGLLGWSHDGTTFYYSTGQAGERFVTERDLQSGSERQVVKVPTECLNNMRLSPDRTMLGCVATDESNRPLKFVTTPVAGGASRVELRVDPGEELSFFWTWLPDARGVILLRSRAGSTDQMWHVPFGGTARKLDVDLSKWTGRRPFHASGWPATGLCCQRRGARRRNLGARETSCRGPASRSRCSSRGCWAIAIPLGLDLYLPVPQDNPLTVAKIELGRRLFFDGGLS